MTTVFAVSGSFRWNLDADRGGTTVLACIACMHQSQACSTYRHARRTRRGLLTLALKAEGRASWWLTISRSHLLLTIQSEEYFYKISHFIILNSFFLFSRSGTPLGR